MLYLERDFFLCPKKMKFHALFRSLWELSRHFGFELLSDQDGSISSDFFMLCL